VSGNERDIDVRAFNREAWNKSVENANPWTIPVSSDAIAAARRSDWAQEGDSRVQSSLLPGRT